MKNPHGVEPTRFMKRIESRYAICCNRWCGPIFGNHYGDLMIVDHCNKENCCCINSYLSFRYECHPEYKSSLFVNTAGPNEKNYFFVIDYEVYTH